MRIPAMSVPCPVSAAREGDPRRPGVPVRIATSGGTMGGMAQLHRLLPVETPDTHEVPGADRQWVTIVWDDPVNLMSYVTWVFQKLFGYSREKAEKLMLDVHHKGRAVVSSGARERMDHDASRCTRTACGRPVDRSVECVWRRGGGERGWGVEEGKVTLCSVARARPFVRDLRPGRGPGAPQGRQRGRRSPHRRLRPLPTPSSAGSSPRPTRTAGRTPPSSAVTPRAT